MFGRSVPKINMMQFQNMPIAERMRYRVAHLFPPVLGIWKPKGIRGREPAKEGLADNNNFAKALILLIDLTVGANTANELNPIPNPRILAHKARD